MVDTADQKFKSALRLYEDGRLDESIALWHDLLSQQPDNLSARYNLGLAFYNRGDTEGAVNEFQAVLRRDLNHIDSHLWLARIWFTQGHINEAIAENKSAIEIDPNYTYIHGTVGECYILRAQRTKYEEDWSLAQQAYEKSLALAQDDLEVSYAMTGLAIIFNHEKKFEKGLQCAQTAVDLNPMNAEGLHILHILQWRIFFRSLRQRQLKQAWEMVKKLRKQRRLPRPLKLIPYIPIQ